MIEMDEYIRKADALLEALPYLRQFRGKVMVIKYGGSAIDNVAITHSVLDDLAFMSFVGIHPVLVHGGGPAINERMRETGKKIEFVDGIRKTDKETAQLVADVLTDLNKQLVSYLNSNGAKAHTLAGRDIPFLQAHQLQGHGDVGFVGEINHVDTAPVEKILMNWEIPVITPTGQDKDGNLYNVNADHAASTIARALKAEKLVLLTNVRGILRDPKDEDSLISTLTEAEIEDLVERKVVQSGMIPKVKSALNALKRGVGKAHILDAKLPHAILLEIFTDRGIGTEVVHSNV
ncbi:MAG: acetylglutamate kinase [Candidatus Omnitrophica bacterium]|nr:acetylglutamate kinase [Candidatus Omnitrophota bacterium]